ncbi:FAD-dependent oxidoreductase [Candidatus Woesearchaeota archaeon]|nr:FAD-dependent oxidoreductase [Candidatus Woesearchaeota archaeon]
MWVKMKASITDKKEIAKGTLLVEFELYGTKAYFKPGQFCSVKLLNPPYTDEKGSQRIFSIVSSPNEKGSITIATRVSGSAFKRSLAELSAGSEVEISDAMGEFTLPEDKDKQVVFITGGIGITPFMSMLRYVQEQKLDYKITLIYSNRDKDSTAFFDELAMMSREMKKNFRLVMTMTDDGEWQGEKQRIDAKFIKDYVKGIDNSIFMMAGPPGMVDEMVKTLKGMGVKEENIRTDSFAGY